jgi:transcriptional regulator with XRE-family HTH domain
MPEQEDEMITMPAIDMAATGRNIARMRQNAGFSVRDLQEFFGFATPQAIYKWQRGDALPTLDNLVILASVFGTTMDAIVIRATDTNVIS